MLDNKTSPSSITTHATPTSNVPSNYPAPIVQDLPWESQKYATTTAAATLTAPPTSSTRQTPSASTTQLNLRGEAREPNWPQCKPIIYHNIGGDIPAGGRGIVRRSYYLYILCGVGYLMNVIAMSALLTTTLPKYSNVGGLLVSIVYFLVLTPLAFMSWHFPLYTAVRTNSSFSYMVYFFFYAVQLIFFIFLGVGVLNGGGGGLIPMIDMFNAKQTGQGIVCGISLAFMVVQLFAGILQYRNVITFYKARGTNTPGSNRV